MKKVLVLSFAVAAALFGRAFLGVQQVDTVSELKKQVEAKYLLATCGTGTHGGSKQNKG